MSEGREKIDPDECRLDLVILAARSTFPSHFDWLEEKIAIRVASDSRNRGLTAKGIRELAREFIKGGGEITCSPEVRPLYSDRRNFKYSVIVKPLNDFPRGLYVEMELQYEEDEDLPVICLLNAHPPTFP